LARADRIQPREAKREYTLGEWLGKYIASCAIKKNNTRRKYEVTKKHLVNFFGEDRLLSSITPGDADEWRESLVKQDTAQATVAREAKRAKQYVEAAVRKRLIEANPFADLKTGPRTNDTRKHHVDRDTVAKVIEACPDAVRRLILALSRFGGLRCHSETLELHW
jgi:site-specific recombinase XerD